MKWHWTWLFTIAIIILYCILFFYTVLMHWMYCVWLWCLNFQRVVFYLYIIIFRIFFYMTSNTYFTGNPGKAQFTWCELSEWKAPLCNLERRVVAGQQQGQVSEGRQCGKRQRLVRLHSQQQPGPARPKPSPACRRPPASHQPAQVSRF